MGRKQRSYDIKLMREAVADIAHICAEEGGGGAALTRLATNTSYVSGAVANVANALGVPPGTGRGWRTQREKREAFRWSNKSDKVKDVRRSLLTYVTLLSI